MPFRQHPLYTTRRHRPDLSIRDCLEDDAWGRYPVFAAQMARRKRLERLPPRGLRWHDRVLLILATVLLGLVLLRSGTVEAADEWGLALFDADQSWTSLALESRVTIEVTGLLARARVEQVFINESDGWVEGTYRFPLPDGAAVDRMQMEVNGRIIVGEIQPREEARRVYQQARAAGQVTSLVEQQRPNQFESRIANIGPGETIQVSIGFQFNVDWRDGSFRLRLPMTFTPRWEGGQASAHIDPAPALAFTSTTGSPHRPLSLEVLLRTTLGYTSIESHHHDVDIAPDAEGYRVALLEGMHIPDRDFELVWTPDLSAAPQAELLTWDGGDAVYAQLMLAPPMLEAIDPRAREVVFIIDTSGSMEGASLDQARAALLRGLDQLGRRDAFNLIQFNSETERLFDASVPAEPRHLEIARDYLAGLKADGGTVMAPALQSAFSLPGQSGLLRQVIFITDGSVGNEPELLQQIAEQLAETRLFTVGIGSAPNSWFMRKAAEMGRGSHTRIARLEDVEQRMSALWSRIRHPALSSICIDFGVEAEYYPEVIPDLYAGDPLWVTARMPLQPREILLCGEFDGLPWEHAVQPFTSNGAEDLARLWARRKIESLEDSILFGSEPDEIRAAVTEVALRFGLLTRHTSLVAVDRTPARPPGEHLDNAEVPSLLPAGSNTATAGFPGTATGWVAQALLATLTLLIATGMFLFSGARLPLGLSRAVIETSRE
jgi:Ca-activated chloride channel family protein